MATKFEILRGDTRIWGPAEWDMDSVKQVFAKVGLNPANVPVKVYGPQRFSSTVHVLPALSFAPKLETIFDAFSPDQGRQVKEDRVEYYFSKIERTFEEVGIALKKTLSEVQRADLKTTFEFNGVNIDFNDSALNRITAYLMRFQAGNGAPFEWRGEAIVTAVTESGESVKGPNHFTVSSLEEVKALADAIGDRMAVSFGVKTAVEKEIDALVASEDKEGLIDYSPQYRFEALISA